MVVLTIVVLEKNKTFQIEVERGDTALTEIAKTLEELFQTGADWAFYFKLTEDEDKYLEQRKTIDELNLNASGYKLLAYIGEKEVAKPAKSSSKISYKWISLTLKIVENRIPPEEAFSESNPEENPEPNKKMSFLMKSFVIHVLVIWSSLAMSELPLNYKADFDLTNPLHIKLGNLLSDFSAMPQCSERSLLHLIILTSAHALTLNDIQILNKMDIHTSSQLNSSIRKEFEGLRENLKKEGLNSAENNESMLKIQGNINNANWDAASVELEDLLKSIRPLDTYQMFRLIMKATEAAKLIKDKEIILFLGPTGSGKSTTIHFLGGSDMAESKEDGKDHIVPIKIKNPSLKEVITSSASISQTQYITPIPVNFEDVDKQLNGNTILCDSPGLGDTSGPEVDIANGIGIIKALQGCKSVKPVIVISSQGLGDKLMGLKGLLKTLAGMIREVKKNKDTLSYFFTKYSDKERKQIFAKLSDVKRTLGLTEKANTNLFDLLDDMLAKTEKDPIIIDPIHDNPGRYLKKLQEIPAITQPGQVFEYSITEESKTTIKEQVRRFERSVMSSIDRFDFTFAKYKLDELAKLSRTLHYDYINESYTSCIKYCSMKLNEGYKAAITSLNRCFYEKNDLNAEDLFQYKEHIERAKKAEEITTAHLGSEAYKIGDLLQNIKQETQKMLQNLNHRRVNEPGVGITLDKLKLLSAHFLEVSSSYDDACKIVNRTISNAVSTFKGFVISDQFEKSVGEMNMITLAIPRLKNHLTHDILEKVSNELRTFIASSLNNCTEGPNSVFAKGILETKDVFALNTCISRIQLANSTLALKAHMPETNLKELYDHIIKKLLNHIKQAESKLTDYFNEKHENSLKRLEKLMEEMSLILTLPSMDSDIAQTYYTTLGKLEKVMRESKTQIENILSLISQRKYAVIPQAEPQPEPNVQPGSLVCDQDKPCNVENLHQREIGGQISFQSPEPQELDPLEGVLMSKNLQQEHYNKSSAILIADAFLLILLILVAIF